MQRRDFIKASAAITTSLVSAVPIIANAGELTGTGLSGSLVNGLKTSDLVYLSPLKSNGAESSCQAEIWFAYDGVDIFVCTNTDSWRTKAIAQGLNTTKFWVGDLGQWKDTNGKYKDLPSLLAKGSIEPSLLEQQRALDLLGEKYRMSWLIWGPRFKKGLANGKRTMLRYRPMA